MADLSHWDFETSFTAEQIACLVIGADPAFVGLHRNRIDPVIRRLESAYRDGLRKCLRRHHDGKPEIPYEGNDLIGGLVGWLEEEAERGRDDFDVYSEIESGNRWDDLHEDRFTRENVARWLAATGLTSVYRFDRGDKPASPAGGARWPWGNHHTEALGHLEAAARKWWGLYDPSEPDTAPTNATVTNWLVNEHGVSKKMAESIASILRADNLRTGPR